MKRKPMVKLLLNIDTLNYLSANGSLVGLLPSI